MLLRYPHGKKEAMNIQTTINNIIKVEGGFSDHPSDRGGPTNYGIIEVVARANGYLGPMIDLPVSLAYKIYLNRYVVTPGFDKVLVLSEPIGEELIDTGVNMGPGIASIFFQRLLNALNAQGSRYADIFVDGRIGPATIKAFQSFLAWRRDEGVKVFVKALNHIQGARYLEIAEANKNQEDFFYGWIKNRT